MATLDKEIKIMMLKGERGSKGKDGQNGADGKSSYELAKENLLFSGTLEEWIETFATPENYFTRAEIQRVTQAEYDKLVETGQVATNCYYLITDDNTLETLESLITTLQNNKVEKVTSNNGYISSIKSIGNQIHLQVSNKIGMQLLVKISENNIQIICLNQNGQVAANFSLLDNNNKITTLEEKITTLEEKTDTLEGKHLYRHDFNITRQGSGSYKVYFSLYLKTNTAILTLSDLMSCLGSRFNINAGGYYSSDVINIDGVVNYIYSLGDNDFKVNYSSIQNGKLKTSTGSFSENDAVVQDTVIQVF